MVHTQRRTTVSIADSFLLKRSSSMDLSTMRGQGLIATSVQTLPGNVLYPTKDSPWQPVVTHLPLIATPTEIPKESIIANTDFTTTSVIAKRRLSSKKRKKHSDQPTTSEESKSPTNLSPSITSTHTLTDEAKVDSSSTVTATIATTTSSLPTLSKSSHQPVAHVAPHFHGGVVGPSPILAAPAPQYITIGNGLSLTHPQSSQVVSQLPPEVAYQLLQEQQRGTHRIASLPSSIEVNQPQPQMLSSTASSSSLPVKQPPPSNKGSQLKWCNAHVFIAKRIQEHQLQQQQQQQQCPPSHHPPSHQPPSLEVLHLHHQQLLQQQHQQQLALLQMYGCLPTHTVFPAISMPEAIHPQLQLQTTAVPLMAPPHHGQIMGIHMPALYPTHSTAVPLALAPPEFTATAGTLMQSHNGSWMAPTVPIVGSCIVNPLQPGLMAATSWVK